MSWQVEEGIGEHRAARIENDELVAARIYWPGALAAGQIEDAKLISRAAGNARGTARCTSGEEALVSGLPRDASEGASLRLEITRAAITEPGRTKLAQAKPTTAPSRPARTLAETLAAEGHAVQTVQRFTVAGWDDLMADAFTRHITFDGGALHLSPTPAMTLIDVDGTLAPRLLALASVPPIAAALQRLDIGGSIGIDFPTLPDKAERRAVDQALAGSLTHWPHERTAMNGFGFVQIVARLERPSILHRALQDTAGAAARLLLRQAEGVGEPGALLLTCNPAVAARLSKDWLAEGARRTGRELRVASDPKLAFEAGFAQAVPL